MTTSRCFACGAAVPETSRFCGNCGRQIVDPDSATVVDEAAGEETLLERLRRVMVGEYEVERELARGGMGVVFEATDAHVGRRVALKVLQPELGITARAAERFKREARMVAELEHPNIVPVYRVGQLGGMLFIAMKYIAGRSLDEITAMQGALPIPAVIQVLRAAARSLAYGHDRDIVHRDIKAANILIDRDARVLVTDFGVALRASDVTLTGDGTVIGTPGYMSPEQCAGKRATPQSDQYSLGVVGFQMLTGRLPFQAESLPGIMHHHFFTPLPSVRLVRDDVPPALLAMVERLVAKAPRDRFRTTRQLLEELEALPFSETDRAEAERLLRELTTGGRVARIATRELPPLPDAPTLLLDGTTPQRDGWRLWTRRRRVATLAGLGVLAVSAWAVAASLRPAAAPPTDVNAAPIRGDSAIAREPAPQPPPPLAPPPPPPPPPVVSPPMGKLRVLTSPGNAEILIDGRPRGVGSMLDAPVLAGVRRLEIRARGYAPFDTMLVVSADSTITLGRVTLRELAAPADPAPVTP